MMKKNLRQIWDQLRAQNAGRRDALRRVTISGLRGIRRLEVPLRFPVSVLAGPNACGKSTVLFSMACAYRPPGAGPKDLVPSTLFPDFKSRQDELPRDPQDNVEIAFDYVIAGQSAQMRWRRKKTWNRSGIPGGKSPERGVYLRTLANLSNPSEVRNLLQMGRHALLRTEVDAADITLAHRILPWKYAGLARMRYASKELLFVHRDDGAAYSEFHMSSGERSVLRLSLELARLNDGLVLIDEVEAGLHPFTQQVLMLELQRLALRNQLQIVVATHSSVVLESVPAEARIFLERQADDVVVIPPHHDVIQRAFYGRALDRLSIVCEDESAEALVRGIFDQLAPASGMVQSDIEIGRNTGKAEFKHHVAAFARFKQLWSTVFVLDGDGAELVPELEAQAARRGQAATVICLPGEAAPELWAWNAIEADRASYASPLGFADESSLEHEMQRIFQTYEGAADSESNKAKGRIWALADSMGHDVPWIMRVVGRTEAERGSGELSVVVQALADAVSAWRNMSGDV
ncbi:MAG: AAA family ATPase [Deltaproteobacteria bacterium]|nr:AAA family ATPase [Deltaproteobacteria bacterium]